MDFLIQFITILAYVLYAALIGRVILSWLNVSPANPIASIIFGLTEPILAPIRRVLPTIGFLDFSPMVAILLISLILSVVRSLA
jgi:YggT family protein